MISLNQLNHSPLTSSINWEFSSRYLPLWNHFSRFRPFSVNFRDDCVWNIQQIRGLWTIQVTQITFLPHSDARFQLQQLFLTMSSCTWLQPQWCGEHLPVCMFFFFIHETFNLFNPVVQLFNLLVAVLSVTGYQNTWSSTTVSQVQLSIYVDRRFKNHL